MAKKIYVGNLSFQTTDDSLRQAFSLYGDVASCAVVIDRYTNTSKGFGFVEMANEQAAATAISAMNGQSIDGRQVRVSEANDKPRADRGGSSGRW
ncbi:MAG TPA: RNA-binding protein [Spirochaetia bacterium]|jgi:RNA recognition motif-containing protein|nr:RNA-binding protein [Spirochaetia bacterium]